MNNKVKLFTEEQLNNTVKAIQDYLDHYDEKDAQDRFEKHLKALKPIELPSDEEIERDAAIGFGKWLAKEFGEFTTIPMEQLYELYLNKFSVLLVNRQ